MTVRIFISYSQEDFKPEARFLCNYLSKHIPDSDVFIDQLKLKGTKWQEENYRRLEESNIMVIILTNSALTSTEVKKEIIIAQSSNKVIIPCKDDLLQMNWNDLPHSLGALDGVEFEKKEELGRKLVGEIKFKLIPADLIENTEKTKPIRILGIPNTNLHLHYKITDGDILSALIDRDSSSLIIALTTFNHSVLELSLPRHLIDAKTGDGTDDFFVLIDGEESVFEENIYEETRKIKIPLLKGINDVEIIGTEILGTSYVGTSSEENIVRILPKSSVPHAGPYLDNEILAINTGQKVKWINDDTVAHTITSGTPKQGQDGRFDSDLFMAENIFEVSFTVPGTFHYFCVVHPWITGTIIVK